MGQSSEDKRSWLRRNAGNPWFATLVTLNAAIVGVLGSVSSEEIKRSFRIDLGGELVPTAAAFWVLLVLFAISFFLRQRATDDGREQAQQTFLDRADELEKAVRSLPPADFLANLASVLSVCHDAVRTVLEPEERRREQIEHAIRVVLSGMLTVVQQFEDSEDVYGVNLMSFRSTSEMDDAEIEAIRGRLKFVEPEIDVRALDGVLDLEGALSASTLTDGDPDEQVPELAIPVPAHAQNAAGAWRILPGAPMAHHKQQLVSYQDTSTLGAWCGKQDFSGTVRDEVAAYFSEDPGKMFASLLSFPVGYRAPPFVVNVHRSSKGLLAHREEGVFFPLMAPFRMLLAELLREREALPVGEAAEAAEMV